ncbi:MAG: selenide, water dikinase SelD [Gemmatimonadota bacterium]|nr:selenide, water dikinase SelD [Gemmatimonadota bacterium]
MKPLASRAPVDIVLVGGGHAHIQVLKDFAMRPARGVRLTVVLDRPIAVYSGMVPGYVAGQYSREELEIDVLPLARLAGARVILSAATGLDPGARTVELDGRPPVPFDLVSLDIGSTVAGLDTPGVREHALPTRPIGRFVHTVEDRLETTRRRGGAPRVVVVGAGAGGVELAFTLSARFGAVPGGAEISLIESGPRILPGYAERLAARVEDAAAERGIRVRVDSPVEAVGRDHVVVDGTRVETELVVWVTGAAPSPSFDASGLPVDDRGFVSTGDALEVVGVPGVFAVGDCATMSSAPWIPRAGVYAVRQGPVLAENLRRAAGGARPRRYRPQRDFLTLLNLGDGTAIGTKWGLSVAGRAVFRLKDRIDRRFVEAFTVLDASDRVAPEFHAEARMRGEMEVACGGCAAKLGQGDLERVMERLSISSSSGAVEVGPGDDAAVVRAPDGLRVVSSVDQFRALTDDPWLTGRIGAVNAASDVLAKGVAPGFAQAVIALPESAAPDEREELLFQIMDGARLAFAALGVELIGGHTTTATDLLVGFEVAGFAGPEDRLLTVDRLAPDHVLILTKPLGTGVLFRADMMGRARGPWVEAAVASMLRANDAAVRIAIERGATAATDVTGFGLARHLATALRPSGVGARVHLSALPVLPGVEALLASGLRSTFHEENARDVRAIAFGDGAVAHPLAPLLFDPQTSGGLLFGVPASATEDTLAALHAAGYEDAAAIGTTLPHPDIPLEVTVDGAVDPGG